MPAIDGRDRDGAGAVPAAPGRRAATLLHGGSLVAGLAVLLWANRGQWFYFDEWDFLSLRGLRGADLGLLQPHGEHWVTVPVLVYRALYAAFGLRTYLPYVAVLVAAHLVAAHLLFRLQLRCGVDPPVAAAGAALFVVLGAADENLLWAFQVTFVAAVAFGLAFVLVAAGDGGWRRRGLAWALAAGALMSSGAGVTLVAVGALAAGVRRGARAALWAAVPPAVLYGVWLAGPGRSGLRSQEVTGPGLGQVPRFVLTGLDHALRTTFGFPAAGLVVAAALAAWVAVRGRRLLAGGEGVAAACAVGAVGSLALAGVGRVSLGMAAARAPRYVYEAVALLLPAIGLAAGAVVRRRPAAYAAVAVVTAAVVAHNLDLLAGAAGEQSAQEQGTRRELLAAADLVASGEALPGSSPQPTWAPNLSLDHFHRMVADGKLPTGRGVGPADRLAAASFLQLALVDAPPPPAPAPASLDHTADVAVTPGAAGCQVLEPRGEGPAAWVRFEARGSVRLQAPAGGNVAVELADGRSGRTGPPRYFVLPAGAPRWLEVARPGSTAILHLPLGTATELCP